MASAQWSISVFVHLFPLDIGLELDELNAGQAEVLASLYVCNDASHTVDRARCSPSKVSSILLPG